ncbi:MAG: flagellar filament capping protein FliD [Candidatus Eisenbacteria bacterium]|nr:flagellar filament capping protein FliD [Candidatus Eisenbacteria bacterium]
MVQTSPGESRLLIQAAGSGREARLTAIGDVAGNLMSNLGLAGQEGDDSPLPATVQAAADALVRLDGLDVRARSNELVGVVPGVTLTLHATSSEARTFRVDRDNEAIVKKLEEFITKYNETLDSVRNLTRASDSSGANRGPLTGEVTILRLRTEMRSAVTASVESDDESALTTLAQIGITADREGNLSLSDRSALQKALADNPDGVEALMNGTDGVAHRLTSLLDRYSKAGGILSLQQDAVQSRLRSLGTRMQRQSESLAKREDALVTRLSQLEAGLVALSQQQSSLNGLLGSSDSLFA